MTPRMALALLGPALLVMLAGLVVAMLKAHAQWGCYLCGLP